MNNGMNFHSTELANPDGLRRLDLRWALFIADPEETWNSTLHLWPEVKALCPRCEPVVRFYRPNIMGESPEFRAKQFCDILTHYFGDQSINAIMGNELDQAIEHAGQTDPTDDWWQTSNGLARIASWLSRYADAHRAIRPQDILHLPACSAGMDKDTYREAMPVEKFDREDIHVYSVKDVEFWGPDAFVSECGIQNGTPEQWSAMVIVLGSTDFCIWEWNRKPRPPDAPPEPGDPAGYAIADRADVIEALAEASREAGVRDLTPPDYVPEIIATSSTNAEYVTLKEDKSMNQQKYLDILADIDTTAEELQVKRLPFASRIIKAKRIQDQCRILDDLKVEGGSEPAPLTTGQKIVAEGRKWLGELTYCWDGKDPAKGCLDCSGYLDTVWKAVTGEPVAGGGGTWWMLDKAKLLDRGIDPPDLQAGDIVFWDEDKTTNTPSHVGIATGEGTVLECTARYNGIVETSWEPEWAERFHSAWRIL